MQRITWIQEDKSNRSRDKFTHFLTVIGMCISLLLLSKDSAPTLFSRGSLIGWLTANMLPCEVMLTKTDCPKHNSWCIGALLHNAKFKNNNVE